MKMFLQLVYICFLLTCFKGTIFAATPFDDFSGSQINDNKWYGSGNKGLDVVRVVSSEKLVSKIRGDINRSDVSSSHFLYNPLHFSNPNSINSISVATTLLEVSMQDDVRDVEAGIYGHFYDEEGGNVEAFIQLAYNGTNLFIHYGIGYSDTFDNGDPFTIPVSLNTEYILKIDYDGGRLFTFWVNNESHVISGPPRKDVSSVEVKYLDTAVQGWDTGPGNGYISATFDNVEVNGLPYEDFSSSPVESKWVSGEGVREIRNGKLQLNVQNPGISKNTFDIWLNPSYSTDFFQADVTIESSTILTGDNTWAETRVYGALYNDTYDGSGYNYSEGEIWGMTRIKYTSGGTLTPQAMMFRCNNDSCGSSSLVWEQDFPTTDTCEIQLDTPATLYLKNMGDTILFGCNQERLKYTVTGNRFASRNDLRKLRSRVHSTSGESGYLEATFDNVYLKDKFPWSSFLPAIMESISR